MLISAKHPPLSLLPSLLVSVPSVSSVVQSVLFFVSASFSAPLRLCGLTLFSLLSSLLVLASLASWRFNRPSFALPHPAPRREEEEE